MFRYLKIKNYKSLNNLYVDFTKTRTSTKKMIAIYGENGIGKSNFVEIFYTLHEILNTMSIKDFIKQFLEDSNNSKLDINDLNSIIKKRFKDIPTIISECKTINSADNLILEFGFSYKNKNGCYIIEMDDKEIVYERLDYVQNKNSVNFFTLSKRTMRLNENIFKDQSYLKEIMELLSRYWGKHSFLSILNYEYDDKKISFIKKKLNSSILDVLDFLNRISVRIKRGKRAEFNIVGISHEIFGQLENGSISLSKKNELINMEKLLNEFFTTLYTDIDSVYYKIDEESAELKYQLFIRKKINNYIIDIDFNNESTGTQNLLDLLPFMIAAVEGQVVVIDEFETGIHDLLVEKIIEKLFDNIKGQLIFTTHNTRLLESQLPNNIMYLLRYNNGIKELVSFDSYGRIQKNVNLRKRYLSGFYNLNEDKDFSINKLISFLNDDMDI